MEHFDVIVIGAGVAGSAAALALAGRGTRVLLLEQHAFGHTRGSSHGGSRIFRHAYEDARYVRLAAEADDLWRQLERDADERLLYRSGGLDIGAATLPALADIERALGAAGRPFERLAAGEVAARFPAFRLGDDEEAVFSPDAGVLAADRCVTTLQRLAHQRGASLRERAPVERIVATADGVEVQTAAERFAAGRLILTAGPWLSEGPLALGLPLHVEQQQVIYLGVERAEPFVRGRFPVFIHYGSFLYGFPLFERPNAIKVSNHAGAPTVRLEARAEHLDGSRAAATAAKAQRLFPQVGGRIVASDLCLYTKTPDEHFVLGAHPEHQNVVVGGGFSGHGFKFGPLLGEILAELALAGASTRDLSLFSPERFGATEA